jgi:hypothetical protein
MMSVTDHDDLVARYSARREDLSPEILAWEDEIARMRAAGQVAPPPDPGDDYLIGLDDDLNPFPVRTESEPDRLVE